MTRLQPRTRVIQALPPPSNLRSPEASGCYLGGVREKENPKPQIPRVSARAESPELAFLGLWHQAASGLSFVAAKQRSSLGEEKGREWVPCIGPTTGTVPGQSTLSINKAHQCLR